jgi:hypothetical protein
MPYNRGQQMNWKQLMWPLLAGVAGIALGGYQATPQLSSCPTITTIAGIGVGMLVATTIVHAWVTSVQVDLNHSGRLSAWCSTSRGRHFLVIGLGVLLTAASLLLDILLWAWVYYHVGAIQGREESLFFSGITFTTVGYGDIALNQCWRLLTVCQSINGVLMAGWSTAQLIFIVQRAMALQLQSERNKSNSNLSS